MTAKKIILVFSFVLMMFCLGCATLGMQKGAAPGDEVFLDMEEVIAVNPDLRFDDLPIPTGFLIDITNSYAFQNQETRVALLRYAGKNSAQSLIQFFVEQMSRYNWVLLNQVEFEKIILNFEKARESCIVMIEPQRNKMLVTISIAPR
ncbi:MAG: hypothetical protein U9Q24_00945 [Candidatus Ratteibacteria bacterium]|nr:hypothetical protein [Candidatus Ratteibacteria bacterium]